MLLGVPAASKCRFLQTARCSDCLVGRNCEVVSNAPSLLLFPHWIGMLFSHRLGWARNKCAWKASLSPNITQRPKRGLTKTDFSPKSSVMIFTTFLIMRLNLENFSFSRPHAVQLQCFMRTEMLAKAMSRCFFSASWSCFCTLNLFTILWWRLFWKKCRKRRSCSCTFFLCWTMSYPNR